MVDANSGSTRVGMRRCGLELQKKKKNGLTDTLWALREEDQPPNQWIAGRQVAVRQVEDCFGRKKLPRLSFFVCPSLEVISFAPC